jgi:hypothetical protein
MRTSEAEGRKEDAWTNSPRSPEIGGREQGHQEKHSLPGTQQDDAITGANAAIAILAASAQTFRKWNRLPGGAAVLKGAYG